MAGQATLDAVIAGMRDDANVVYEANSVATTAQINAFLAAMFALPTYAGATAANNGIVLARFNRYLFDNGASGAQNFPAPATIATINNVDYGALAMLARQHCVTLRRYAAFWSPDLYNEAFLRNKPPAKWRNFNFTEQTKWVGFDFSGALAAAAQQRRIPLRRELTDADMAMIDTNQGVHIRRARTTTGTTATELTRGRYVGHGQDRLGLD